MQHLLSSFLLSIACNVDNFTIGIAYGVKKIRIGILSNLLIAFVSGLGTFVSMMAGKVICNYLPDVIANALGSGALTAIGIWSVWSGLRAGKKNKESSLDEFSYKTYLEHPEKADKAKSGCVGLKESVALAFGLTINNLGGGIGGGISGLSIVPTTVLTFIFSLLAIIAGYFLGNYFTAKMSAAWSAIVSGCLILGLGIYEYFVP